MIKLYISVTSIKNINGTVYIVINDCSECRIAKLWAVSNLVKKILTGDYCIPEDKIFVLHNGVDINKYHPLNDEERTKIREKWDLKKRP
jgi:glycosyltransferase involved in cell wall biosynthesis